MSLSKRVGFNHLFYEDAAGKRHSMSTGCTIKVDAMKFLKSFDAELNAKQQAKLCEHALENRWRMVTKPKAPETLPAYFTAEQFRTLLKAIQNRDLRDLVTVAALTGMRQAGLFVMMWQWIDFESRTIIIQNSEGFTTKPKRVRVIPIADEAYTILLGRPERTSERSIHAFEEERMTPGHVTFKVKQTIIRAGLPER
jgi:integrase